MKLLVIDGNSIVNRAFYGIKLLTTKDGKFTNGIYGFLSILLRLTDEVEPDAVVIAFDVKAPTFRHKMYDGYKAQRKGMPPELAEQMPTLKKLLRALGYTLLECEGWEADDILGTLAAKSGENSCFIATGDRDSLQLVDDNVTVLLTATKMGRPQTIHYDKAKIAEDYGVTPHQLIDIKAIMGDSSDNIPGVAGIGEKGAKDLIGRFGSIEYIYENIDTIDIKDGIRKKLIAGKDSAFLSYTLGTISREAPIDTAYESFVIKPTDNFEAVKILSELEMFSMIDKLHLDAKSAPKIKADKPKESLVCVECDNTAALLASIKSSGKAYFTLEKQADEVCGIFVKNGGEVSHISSLNLSFASFVSEIFEDEAIQKITDNSKSAFAFAENSGTQIKALSFDSTLAGYILNPSSNDYSVGRLAMEYNIPLPENADEGCALNVFLLEELEEVLGKKLEENGQISLLREIEIPLAEVLASMELTGFEVDKQGIIEFGKKLEEDIEKITDEIYSEVGYEFNLNSPKQLGEALFNDLQLPHGKKTKSGWSTSADILEKLAPQYPIVEKILQYRTWAKLKSTYCDGLLKCIADDGRIHSTLNQTETRTGRISSTEPNLQNIPVRSELGKEMRKFFRAKAGCVLVDADYSQIELRVLAHIANDENMINDFNSGDDIHAITASQVFNMPLQMVTPIMRSRAKAVNFGIVYGIGAFSLGQSIGVSRAEADSYIKGYLNHYSGINSYMQTVIEQAKETGYVETLFHRRRYLPELTQSNGMLRAFGERVARNMPIQGTAADIIKIAMVRVFKRIKQEKLNANLIMQVHDELIIETEEKNAQLISQLLKEEMEKAVDLKIKMLADVNYGKSWFDAKG